MVQSNEVCMRSRSLVATKLGGISLDLYLFAPICTSIAWDVDLYYWKLRLKKDSFNPNTLTQSGVSHSRPRTWCGRVIFFHGLGLHDAAWVTWDPTDITFKTREALLLIQWHVPDVCGPHPRFGYCVASGQ